MGGEKAKVEASYVGNKFAYVTHGSKGDNRMGFNGTLAWFTTDKGIQAVPLQYAVKYVNEKAVFLGADSLPKLTNPTGATAKIAGKDQLVVSGTISSDRTRVSLFFDKATGLLTRTSYSYPTILGSIAQLNDFSNYRKINGVEVPLKIVNHATEGDTVLEFKSAKIDNKINVASFDPPKK